MPVRGMDQPAFNALQDSYEKRSGLNVSLWPWRYYKTQSDTSREIWLMAFTPLR